MPDVAAIILAAGGSARLGAPKQLIRFHGQTLLRRAALATLESGCEPVVVVLGAESDEMRRELKGLKVHIALNEDWSRGIGSSIRTGMQSLLRNKIDPPQAVLISLCDQPLVDAEALRGLIAARVEQKKEICVSTYSGAIGPPVVVGSTFFKNLLALPDAQGAKSLWTENTGACAFFDCSSAATDIDTPRDVQALRTLGQVPASEPAR